MPNPQWLRSPVRLHTPAVEDGAVDLLVSPAAPARIPLVSQALAGQTAALYEARNAAGVALARITSSGDLSATTLTPTGLPGATSISRHVGATAVGAPTSGTFVLGDWTVARNGQIWVCTTAGTPGTWTQVGAGISGLPAGGAANDVLMKNTAADYDSRWAPLVMTATQTTTTTTAMSATPALTVAQLNGTANNWTEIEFKGTGPVTAGVIARNLDHANGYGELSLHTRSAAGMFARLRLPSTGGQEVYGDAGTVVSSTTNTGSVRVASPQTTATLGVDRVTNGTFTSDLAGWTAGAGWAWAAGTALHSAGSTAALSQTVSGLTVGTVVKVSWTVTGRTAGSFNVGMDGTSIANAFASNSTYTTVSSATPLLVFTPTTDFNGAFDNLTVQVLIPSVPQVYLDGAPGTSSAEIRASGGCLGAGQSALSGIVSDTANHTAYGYNALRNATSGNSNTAVGYGALAAMVSGTGSVAIGASALSSATSGGSNVAVGTNALLGATTSSQTVAVGFAALRGQTTGANTALGYNAGFAPLANGAYATTTGTHQTVLGQEAGQFSATVSDDLVCVGYRAVAAGNATAVGSGVSASGLGSVAIGKDSGGTSATATVNNDFVLGTANHNVIVPGNFKLPFYDSLQARQPDEPLVANPAVTGRRSVATLPFAHDWHDLFRFGGLGLALEETSANGTAWTSRAITTSLFDGTETAVQTVIGAPNIAVRWTWNNAIYTGVQWIRLAMAYMVPQPNLRLVLEGSPDGTTWTTLLDKQTYGVHSSSIWLPTYGYFNDQRTRLTITITNPGTAGSALMTSVEGYTINAGNQALGRYSQYPYSWNYQRQIAVGGGVPANSALTIGTNTTTAAGGLHFGTDCGIYRSGTSTMMMNGNVFIPDGASIIFGSFTGSRIGQANNQKLAFWGGTPVPQSTGWSATGGYTTQKSFNPESASLTEGLRALATLIDTLKTYGILG